MPGNVLRLGGVKPPQTLTCTLFDPAICHDSRKSEAVSHWANEPRYLVHGTSFRVLSEKGNTGGHGVSQRQEKSLIRDLPAKGVTLPQKLLLAGSISEPPHNPLILWCFGRFGWQNQIYYKTWVPPSHPTDYFSTFEMNTKSKEPVRKMQGKGN